MSTFPLDTATNVILDSIADGVFTVDEDWRITSFNSAAEKITGVSRKEAIGQPCCDVFRASVCEGECVLKESIRTGRSIVNRAIYIVNAAGERIPISISTAILKDGDGRVAGGIETFRDLSVVEELRRELRDKYTFADIIGRSHRMRELFDILPQLAESDATVLIEGASGTGKELFARALHNLSARKEKRFVAINCGALPDALLESELFGYKAGAFTDARQDKPGRLVIAEGGTVFLDEIGDISPAMQVRLLRVLQERVVEPLGSVDSVPVDIRIIAASNKNLETLVKKGRFREDLFYRLNVIRLALPALQERKEDTRLLVEHFVHKFQLRHEKDIQGISEEAMAALEAYDFPGNVRELENAIEHAFVLCRGGLIAPEHLPLSFRASTEMVKSQSKAGLTLSELERYHIEDAVRRHHGNRTAAAKELDINASTLFRKIKSMGLILPEQDGRSRRDDEGK